MKNKIKQLWNYFKTPKSFNVILLLMDHEEIPLIVEITQVAYNIKDAEKSVVQLIKQFNYKYSANYQIDKLWEIRKKMVLSRQGKTVAHHQIDLTRVGEKQNWDHIKSEYDFIQSHYVHKDLNLEG